MDFFFELHSKPFLLLTLPPTNLARLHPINCRGSVTPKPAQDGTFAPEESPADPRRLWELCSANRVYARSIGFLLLAL